MNPTAASSAICPHSAPSVALLYETGIQAPRKGCCGRGGGGGAEGGGEGWGGGGDGIGVGTAIAAKVAGGARGDRVQLPPLRHRFSGGVPKESVALAVAGAAVVVMARPRSNLLDSGPSPAAAALDGPSPAKSGATALLLGPPMTVLHAVLWSCSFEEDDEDEDECVSAVSTATTTMIISTSAAPEVASIVRARCNRGKGGGGRRGNSIIVGL